MAVSEQDQTRFHRAAEAFVELDESVFVPGFLCRVPQARDLFDAVDQIVLSAKATGDKEAEEAAFSRLWDLHAESSGTVKHILTCAIARRGDGVFLNHGSPGVRVSRQDHLGYPPPEEKMGASDLDGLRAFEPCDPGEGFRLALVGKDSAALVLTRPNERPILSAHAAVQVLVPWVPDSPAAVEAEGRPLDEYGLLDTLATTYRSRLARRVAWGTASCLFTDQRLIGAIFDEEVSLRPKTPESEAMPLALCCREYSSVLMFTVDRDQFERRDIAAWAGSLARLTSGVGPRVNLIGKDCDLALDFVRVVTPECAVRRVEKGEIEEAVNQFCGEDGSVA